MNAYKRQFNPGNKVSLYRFGDDKLRGRAINQKLIPGLKADYFGVGPSDPLSYRSMYGGKLGSRMVNENVFKVDVPVEDLKGLHWSQWDNLLNSYPKAGGSTNFKEFILTEKDISKYGMTKMNIGDHTKRILNMKKHGGKKRKCKYGCW